MSEQDIFNFNFISQNSEINFYTNATNIEAYNGVLYSDDNNIFLTGPIKSGKTYLGNLWLKKYDAILYKDNFDSLINNRCNIFIDNIELVNDEEKLFHILNHCKLNNLHLLVTSEFGINDVRFNLKDLSSRIKVFSFYEIYQPDDDMLLNILTKLFIEKQFIINSHEIFNFIIKRANRSYADMLKIVTILDKLSLSKKRQLTIPLIKEIL